MLGIGLPDPRGSSVPGISNETDLLAAGDMYRNSKLRGDERSNPGKGRPAQAQAVADDPSVGEDEPRGRIIGEEYDSRFGIVFYQVRWSDGRPCTWETSTGLGTAAAQMLSDWLAFAGPQAAAVQQVDEDEILSAVDEYSGPRPPGSSSDTSDSMEATPAASRPMPGNAVNKAAAINDAGAVGPSVAALGGAGVSGNSGGNSSCNKYVTGRFEGKSCGVAACFDACGYPNAPMELVDPESKSNMLSYILRLYSNEPMKRPGKKAKYIGYDNCCNLVRSLEKIKHVHAKLEELSTDVVKVVDKFHFKGHTGSYCHQHTNPHSWPDLKNANMSVAEQAFQVQGRLKRSFRYFNRSRFQYMLQDVCKLQQRVRDMGLVELTYVQEEAASDVADAEVASAAVLV